MEETPAKQYIFAPANPIYHLAWNDRLTVCGLWLHGRPDQRRRRDDRRLSLDRPTGQFVALCSTCERKTTNSPEPKRPSRELLPRHPLTEIIP